jgi:hypothetical protein
MSSFLYSSADITQCCSDHLRERALRTAEFVATIPSFVCAGVKKNATEISLVKVFFLYQQIRFQERFSLLQQGRNLVLLKQIQGKQGSLSNGSNNIMLCRYWNRANFKLLNTTY